MATDSPAEVFAATPPVEAIRYLCSLGMSKDCVGGKGLLVLGFLDVSRTHFHSPCLRTVFIQLPDEDPEKAPGFCGRLLQSVYGTRGAAQNFDRKAESTMEALGFTVGKYNPCLYHNEEKQLKVVRHGDDSICLGTRDGQRWFHEELGKHPLMKLRGVLGPDRSRGDIGEIRCPNRSLRWERAQGNSPEHIAWEPDPRHAEILMAQLGLEAGSNGVTSPGIKVKPTPDCKQLDAETKAAFRSATMRLAYLAQDRTDLAYASKQVARRMQDPDMDAWLALKRCVRYLVHRPRVIHRFYRQRQPKKMAVFSDTHHAGCLRTRRSTPCTLCLHGKHLLSGSSTTQVPIALSTGESEFYALTKSIARGLGLKSMAADLGEKVDLEVNCDASAAKGIVARRGAGRLRHIDCALLWYQKAYYEKLLTVHKWPGEKNPADMGTKHLAGPKLRGFAEMIGYIAETGSSVLRLKAAL